MNDGPEPSPPPAAAAHPAQPPALPWLHPTMVALATALGCSVRTLENWRPRGAPIGADGPWDELAVRLWVLAERLGGRPMKTLADPAPALAPYLAHLTKVRPPRQLNPKALGDVLKRKQAAFLDQRLAERQQLAQQQATDAFLSVLGKLDQLWEREVGAQLPQLIHDTCWNQPSAAAIPPLQQILRDTYRSVRRRALGK